MLTGIEKQETLFMGYQMQWKMCPGIQTSQDTYPDVCNLKA